MTKAALSYMPSQVEQWKENRRQRRGGEFWKLAFVCLTSFSEVQPFASLSVPTWGRTRALLALRSHLAYTILNDLLFGVFFFFWPHFHCFSHLSCKDRPHSMGLLIAQQHRQGLAGVQGRSPLSIKCCVLRTGVGTRGRMSRGLQECGPLH